MEVCYVGLLRAKIDPKKEDDIRTALMDRFNCLPVFIPPELVTSYYHGFCKRYLWPLFHYKLPSSDGQFDESFWKAYVIINKKFSRKVMEAIKNSTSDYVWIHDYHLMLLPTLLRRHQNRLKVGFFLHSVFPSSEVFQSIPTRTEILKGILNSDIIGFHTFDYARNFLSCCRRMFGLDCQLKSGYISLNYSGRVIKIKIMPTGINVGHMESILRQPDTKLMIRELQRQFQGKKVIIGVDDLDVFKGVNLKVLAMEHMIKSNPNCLKNTVLVQILNPARGQGPDVAEIDAQIKSSCERINEEMGSPGYQPIVLISRPISLSERAAYYTVSEAAIVTPVRDGMNLMPFEYVVCWQGNLDSPKCSTLVVSEFIGCSRCLSGAIRVNPWDVMATAEAMKTAISASDDQKQKGHMNHYRYITTHNIAKWSLSFVEDLETACVAHNHNDWQSFRYGLTSIFRSNFKRLSFVMVENAYRRLHSRAILLDYDGTIMPSINKLPTDLIISTINQLCHDPKNTVFVISGRSKENLGRWFSPCEKLAIAAEHGYFIRWAADEEWQTCGAKNDITWMDIAEPIMNQYTKATDGSYIEYKETAMVWHHENADPEFGSNQARELSDHLRSVLANQPVAVSQGRFIVEAKPQGVDKGVVATKIFESMAENGRRADFVLCFGDDKSDEDMFVAVDDGIKNGQITNNGSGSVFACTVGKKQTEAEYYLDDTIQVQTMLDILGDR